MIRRQVIALLALVGALDATYLLLHKLGVIGDLACGAGGGCSIVNTSMYSSFLGVPVAGIGLLGYLLILAVALYAARPEASGDSRPDYVLAALAGVGTFFSLWLTYLSLYQIGTACPYCLLSLGMITSIFGIAVWSVVVGGGAAGRSDV